MINKRVILIISFFLLFDCYFVNAQISTIQIIKTQKWLTYSATAERPVDLNNKGKASLDLLSQSPFCVTDDIFIFEEHNIFIKDDNQNTCSEFPKKEKGTWKTAGADSLVINFGKEGPVIKFKIVEATDSDLILMTNMPFVPGGVNVRYVFKSVKK